MKTKPKAFLVFEHLPLSAFPLGKMRLEKRELKIEEVKELFNQGRLFLFDDPEMLISKKSFCDQVKKVLTREYELPALHLDKERTGMCDMKLKKGESVIVARIMTASLGHGEIEEATFWFHEFQLI